MKVVESVLVVDDNPADLELVTLLLEETERFRRILSARDGEEALEVCRRLSESPAERSDAQPLLILLDLKMPRMNGFEFLAEYQRAADTAARPLGPVVVLSSSSDPRDLARAREHAVVRDYVTKPLREADALRLAEEFGSPD